MASSNAFILIAAVLVLILSPSNVFYHLGSYMHTYSKDEKIFVKVNSLTSIKTELPFSYYSLPYCPTTGDIKKSAENLGELLIGNQIDNSPYRFRGASESVYLYTKSPLTESEVKLLEQRMRDMYQVNMIRCLSGRNSPLNVQIMVLSTTKRNRVGQDASYLMTTSSRYYLESSVPLSQGSDSCARNGSPLSPLIPTLQSCILIVGINQAAQALLSSLIKRSS